MSQTCLDKLPMYPSSSSSGCWCSPKAGRLDLFAHGGASVSGPSTPWGAGSTTIDLILLRMALAEARIFETVPLKVTMNEYIDLAKFYSTEKSGAFVNGVLDAVARAVERPATSMEGYVCEEEQE